MTSAWHSKCLMSLNHYYWHFPALKEYLYGLLSRELKTLSAWFMSKLASLCTSVDKTKLFCYNPWSLIYLFVTLSFFHLNLLLPQDLGLILLPLKRLRPSDKPDLSEFPGHFWSVSHNLVIKYIGSCTTIESLSVSSLCQVLWLAVWIWCSSLEKYSRPGVPNSQDTDRYQSVAC